MWASVCFYICISLRLFLSLCFQVFKCVFCVCVYAFVCVAVICVCISVCAQASVCFCVGVFMWVCMYTCVLCFLSVLVCALWWWWGVSLAQRRLEGREVVTQEEAGPMEPEQHLHSVTRMRKPCSASLCIGTRACHWPPVLSGVGRAQPQAPFSSPGHSPSLLASSRPGPVSSPLGWCWLPEGLLLSLPRAPPPSRATSIHDSELHCTASRGATHPSLCEQCLQACDMHNPVPPSFLRVPRSQACILLWTFE